MAFVALITLPLWLLIAKVDELFRKSCWLFVVVLPLSPLSAITAFTRLLEPYTARTCCKFLVCSVEAFGLLNTGFSLTYSAGKVSLLLLLSDILLLVSINLLGVVCSRWSTACSKSVLLFVMGPLFRLAPGVCHAVEFLLCCYSLFLRTSWCFM